MYVRLNVGAANPPGTKQFLAGTMEAQELIANAGDSRIELAKAYYLIGLGHFAARRLTEAQASFRNVIDQGLVTWPMLLHCQTTVPKDRRATRAS